MDTCMPTYTRTCTKTYTHIAYIHMYMHPYIIMNEQYKQSGCLYCCSCLSVAAEHQLFVSIASNPYLVLRRLYHEKEACGYTTFELGLITLHSQLKMIITFFTVIIRRT